MKSAAAGAMLRKAYARHAYGYEFRESHPPTPDELGLLNALVQRHGQAYVDQWEELILMHARALGVS